MGGQRSQGKVLCPGKKTAKIHHEVEEQEEGKELQNKVDSLIPVRREKDAGGWSRRGLPFRHPQEGSGGAETEWLGRSRSL